MQQNHDHDDFDLPAPLLMRVTRSDSTTPRDDTLSGSTENKNVCNDPEDII
jgi:hypothetical protein